MIGYVPGKGKYTGMMGALRVETADGKRFQIGTGFKDAVRANPPAIGTLITYTYRGLTKNGLPQPDSQSARSPAICISKAQATRYFAATRYLPATGFAAMPGDTNKSANCLAAA